MLSKISVLIGAAAVTLGAVAGFADPFDTNRTIAESPPACSSDSTCDQNRTAFGNGYSYGYRDGYARRRQDTRHRADMYDYGSRDRGSNKGAYYYISTAPGDGHSSVAPRAASPK